MPKAASSKKKITKTSPVRGKTASKQSLLTRVGALTRKPLVMAALFLVVFGGIGTFSVLRSQAYTAYLDNRGCTLRGRIYTGSTSGNPCSNKCYPPGTGEGAGYLVYATPYNYCNKAVTKASTYTTITKCQALGRVWLSGTGCARYWPRINNAYNVPQCAKAYQYYKLSTTTTGYDYCWPYKY